MEPERGAVGEEKIIAAQMFPCPHQPGSVFLTTSACAKMWLKAQAHPVVERWRKQGKQAIPNSMIGTSLGECLDCAEGCANAAAMRAGETSVSSGSTEEKSEMSESTNGNSALAQKPLSRREKLSAEELDELRARDRASKNAVRQEKLFPYRARDGSKRCRRCEEVKPLSEYLPHKAMWDGYRAECEGCRRMRHRELKAGAKPKRSASAKRNVVRQDAVFEPSPVKGGQAGGALTTPLLSIPIEARDQGLYQRLTELARMERRSPEQQVLWILERFFSEQGRLAQGVDQ